MYSSGKFTSFVHEVAFDNAIDAVIAVDEGSVVEISRLLDRPDQPLAGAGQLPRKSVRDLEERDLFDADSTRPAATKMSGRATCPGAIVPEMS